MADERTTIRLEVQDGFSQPLQNFNRQMEQAAQSTHNLNRTTQGGGWRQTAQDIFYAGQSLNMVASTAMGVLRTVDGIQEMGNQSIRTRSALEAMAGGASQAEKYIQAINEATLGTTTRLDAMNMSMMAQTFHLADSAEEMGELARITAVIGATSPSLHDANAAMSELGMTIANMSWRRLDQLGLAVGDVKKRFEELKREGLGEEDAFQTAVMEGLQQRADLLGESVLGVGDATARLKARWSDVKTEIFEGAAIAIEGFAELTEKALENASALADQMNKIAGVWTLNSGLGDLLFSAASTVSGNYNPGANRTQEGAFDTFSGGAMPQLNGSQMADYVTVATGTNGTVWGPGDQAFVSQFTRMEGIGGRGDAGGFSRDLATGQERPGVSTADLQALSAFNASFNEGLAGAVAGLTGGLQAAGEAARQFTNDFGSLAEKFGLVTDGIPVEVFGDLSDALAAAGMEQDAINASLEEYQRVMGLVNEQSEMYDRTISSLSEKLANNTISQDSFTQAAVALTNLSPAGFEGMSKMWEGVTQIPDLLSDPSALLGDLFDQTGERSADFFATAQQGFVDTTAIAGNEIAKWEGKIIDFQNLSTGQIETMTVAIIDDLDRIQEKIDEVTKRGFTIRATVIADISGGSAPKNATRNQYGGRMTDGGLSSVVENGEPEVFEAGGQTYLIAPRGGGVVTPTVPIRAGGGGSGQSESVNVTVQSILDGRMLAESVASYLRTQDGQRLTVGAGV